MQHQVIVTQFFPDQAEDDRHPGRKGRRAKTGFINCDNKAQADHVADVLRRKCGLQAEPVVKLWQPGGGSVTLDYTAIERIAEMYLESGSAKPNAA